MEIWKPIVGYEDYNVSNFGNIKSFKHSKVGRILAHRIQEKGGYAQVVLCKNGECKMFYVHRIVLMTFEPKEDKSLMVNHKDCNKQNNHIDNLEWVTRKGNGEHAATNNLLPHGEKNILTKLSDADAAEVRRRRLAGESPKSLAKEFGIHPSHVWRIATGRLRRYRYGKEGCRRGSWLD